MNLSPKIISQRSINFSQDNYWVNIDKPINYSSAKVVSIIKRITKAKKVGHGGTLDPFATGVLPIAVNKCTKQSNEIMNYSKKYFVEINFGEFRDTDDTTGKIVQTSKNRVNLSKFAESLTSFLGKIKQQPSKFSAIKINGVRSYKLAREGKDFEMPWREVFIKSIKVLKFSNDSCELEFECSKGTYIRTLVHDICIKNNICGYVENLKRLEVGAFKIHQTISLDDLKNSIMFGQSYKDGSLLDLH
ncbi:MAG: tRNA pseudouridine(55) synthase TruB [Proteobacteria bacterium]|jgi:tRNA pseudouridine55 synthase|nr:tRNA pseudouridine(55) synthase TruB [Pseudomonadota bacterium]